MAHKSATGKRGAAPDRARIVPTASLLMAMCSENGARLVGWELRRLGELASSTVAGAHLGKHAYIWTLLSRNAMYACIIPV